MKLTTRRPALLFAILALPVGCSNSVDLDDVNRPGLPTGRVEGIVTRPAGGPVAGALIEATSDDGSIAASGDPVRTGTNGGYAVELLSFRSSGGDAQGEVSISAPAGSGLRDTVVADVILRTGRFGPPVTTVDAVLSEE